METSRPSGKKLEIFTLIENAVSALKPQFKGLILIALVGQAAQIPALLMALSGSVILSSALSTLFAIANFILGVLAFMAITYILYQQKLGNTLTFQQAFSNIDMKSFLMLCVVYFLYIVCVGAGLLLLVLPGIYLATIFSLAPVIYLLEKKPILECFKASNKIISPHLFPVMGMYVVMLVIGMLAAMITGIMSAVVYYAAVIIPVLFAIIATLVVTSLWVELYYDFGRSSIDPQL